jgi:hypothetical protein
MVLSLIFLSFSQGKFIMVALPCSLISARDCRILSSLLILQCTGRNISQQALQTTNCGRWSLVQHSTWLGNRHCMHGWGIRRHSSPSLLCLRPLELALPGLFALLLWYVQLCALLDVSPSKRAAAFLDLVNNLATHAARLFTISSRESQFKEIETIV